MKAIQSYYNPYIVKFYVSTIFNFPSPQLLAGLPHFLHNDFSDLASHVEFSKSCKADHLCPSSPFPGPGHFWGRPDFLHHTHTLWVYTSLCSVLALEKRLSMKAIQTAVYLQSQHLQKRSLHILELPRGRVAQSLSQHLFRCLTVLLHPLSSRWEYCLFTYSLRFR